MNTMLAALVISTGVGGLIVLLVALALVYWLVPLDGFWKKIIQALAITVVVVVILILLGWL